MMQTQMSLETREAPGLIANYLTSMQAERLAVIQAIRAQPIRMAISFARGSSDHATTLAHHLLKTRYGIWSFSCPPSQLKAGFERLDFENTLAFAISQSGQSTDLLDCINRSRRKGAFTLAILNARETPMHQAADWIWSIGAGVEQSVAATKSFICSLVSVLDFIGTWQDDDALKASLTTLPTHLDRAIKIRWDDLIEPLAQTENLLLVSRGPMMTALEEAALKLKETCQIHATAYSAAELQHGPLALVGPRTHVWVIAPPGPDAEGLIDLASRLRQSGAMVTLFTANTAARIGTSFHGTGNAYVDVISWITSFYLFVDLLAAARGLNPDAPPRLQKVTITS
jgi:glutamine---fructose-6-phosphate transaminase (isomerizing)